MVKPQGLKMTYVSFDDMMSASARAYSWFVPPLKSTPMGDHHWDRRLSQIGDMRGNQRRPRRVDETVSTNHGCNEGVRIRHNTNNGAYRSNVINSS